MLRRSHSFDAAVVSELLSRQYCFLCQTVQLLPQSYQSVVEFICYQMFWKHLQEIQGDKTSWDVFIINKPIK